MFQKIHCELTIEITNQIHRKMTGSIFRLNYKHSVNYKA